MVAQELAGTGMNRRYGFSLVELIAGLVFIGIVAGLVSLGGFTVGKSAQQRAGVVTLISAQAEGQRVAMRNPLTVQSETLQSFPETEDMVDSLSVTGIIFTSSASEGSSTVSVKVLDSTSAVYAVFAGEKCLYNYDQLDGVDGWAYSLGTCNATALSGALLENLSTASSDPTLVDVV
jgi:hypothetical protein